MHSLLRFFDAALAPQSIKNKNENKNKNKEDFLQMDV